MRLALLLPKFGATLCLITCGVFGFDIEVEDSFDSANDVAKYDANYEGLVDFEVSFKMPGDNFERPSQRRTYQTTSEYYNINELADDNDVFDSWSVVWYVASFGGLIGFFLLVSCSEWCCRKHIRESQARRTPVPPSVPSTVVSETPPPAYDLFAPPSYESLTSSPNNNNEKSEYDIYVVPVHAIRSLVDTDRGRQENPPSYSLISVGEADTTVPVRT